MVEIKIDKNASRALDQDLMDSVSCVSLHTQRGKISAIHL